MPLEITQFPLDSDHIDQLTSVLRENNDVLTALAQACEAPDSARTQLWIGIFNAKPVSLALLERELEQAGAQWQVSQLVVHPATRNRGVGAETLRLIALQQPFQAPASLHVLAQRAGLI
jgi:hypothetical protein